MKGPAYHRLHDLYEAMRHPGFGPGTGHRPGRRVPDQHRPPDRTIDRFVRRLGRHPRRGGVCHLRLRPKRAATTTVAAFFDSVQLAAEASVAIARARIQSDVAELLDPAVLAPSIPCRESTSSRVAAFLLVQTDGAGADMEAESVRTAVAGLAARFR
jgi:hypothetical protein